MAVVRYLVNDPDAAATFYAKHLGFALMRRWGPALSMIKRDDLELWLSDIASLNPDMLRLADRGARELLGMPLDRLGQW